MITKPWGLVTGTDCELCRGKVKVKEVSKADFILDSTGSMSLMSHDGGREMKDELSYL